jgi:hypothetical protein
MAAGAWLAATVLPRLLGQSLSGKMTQLITVILGISVGGIIYFALSFVLKSRELRELKGVLHRK